MKKYVYRKHLVHPIKQLLGTLAYVLFILLYFGTVMIVGLTTVERSKLLDNIGIILLVILGMTLFIGIEFLIIYFLMMRKFKNINISLGEDEIIYNNMKGQQVIKYEDIEKLTFPSIKYTGGWVRIKYKGGNVRLTVVLEGIGDFIKELKDILDEKEMNSTYNEKKLYSFYKTATYADQSWERLYSKFKNILKLEGMAVIVGFLASLIVTGIPLKLIASGIIVIYPIITFSIAEFVLGRKLAKLSKVEGYEIKNRNIELEDKTYKNVYLIGSFIVAVLVIIIMFI